MDPSEKLARKYLRVLGYKNILYEPDGNSPPDFLVENKIAIEVRRLNQNFNDGVKVQGLEEHEIPLWKNMLQYLDSLNRNVENHNQSWFVFFDFNRPLPSWRILRRELDKALKPFAESINREGFNIEILPNFRLEVSPSSLSNKPLLIPGGYSDNDAGGWVLHEIGTNLQLCVAEKARKISPYRDRYPEWWLILPIHMLFGQDDFEELLQSKDFVLDSGGFDKIIVLDSRTDLRAFQYHPK